MMNPIPTDKIKDVVARFSNLRLTSERPSGEHSDVFAVYMAQQDSDDITEAVESICQTASTMAHTFGVTFNVWFYTFEYEGRRRVEVEAEDVNPRLRGG